MSRYTIRNDFHNTEARVRTTGISHIWSEVNIKLTEGQIRRARRALCGVEGCTCASGASGRRGAQFTDDGKKLIIDDYGI